LRRCLHGTYFVEGPEVLRAHANLTKEAEKNIIKLQNDSEAAVNAMISYFYRGDYVDGVSDLLVYNIADKYNISTLATLAAEKVHH